MKTFDYMKLADQMRDSEILTYIAKNHEYMRRQELYIRQKPVELGRRAVIARIQSTESSNKIQPITMNRPSVYGEYEIYHFTDTEAELKKAVVNMLMK